MSEFEDSWAAEWPTMHTSMGDTAILNSETVDVIVQGLEKTTSTARYGGRVREVSGQLAMLTVDWVAAAGAKGQKINFNGQDYRIVNEPNLAYSTVVLDLKGVSEA